jgi:Integrase core domain
MLLGVLTGWLDRQERQALKYLMEENRVLRRQWVQIVGSTPHPDDLFMRQVTRMLTVTDGLLSDHDVLIRDRDRKWSGDVRQLLGEAGVQVVQTPFQAPNANAHAERFVRSTKYECLDRIVPLGERHFRSVLKEFVDHYHCERNHQGLENRLIEERALCRRAGRICRRPRLGGLLNYYERAA